MANFKIMNLNKLAQDIEREIRKQALPKILQQAANESAPLIVDQMVEALKRTTVWQGLYGTSYSKDEDVSAHLGLDASSAYSAAREMEKIIRDSLRLETMGGRSIKGKFTEGNFKGAVRIQFRLLREDIEERMASIPGGSYQSNGNDIDWMNWLINGYRNGEDYRIVFAGDIENLNIESGRSGRALMVPMGIRGGTTWDIDDYKRFAKNENFIDDIMEDEFFLNESNTILTNSIISTANSYRE